jgi:hypothetical protein
MEILIIPLLPYEDAVELAKQFPDTFHRMSNDELMAEIKVGSFVKISTGNERFWCQVKEIVGEELYAIINNDLLYRCAHGLSDGDLLKIHINNVYNVLN